MPLILCSSWHLLSPLPKGVPNTRCFVSHEDYTVGPLADWPDPEQFRAARTAWWGSIGALDLPTGDKYEYFDWLRVLPRWQRDEPEPDLTPDRHRFISLVAAASRIGVWYHDDLTGRVWLWQVLADLARAGVDPARVETCNLGSDAWGERSKAFWQGMLKEAPDHPVRPEPVTEATLNRASRLWRAIIALPNPPDPDLLSDTQILADFDCLSGRIVDPKTGLSALRWRLLDAATPEFRPMARTVGEAMVMGFTLGDWVGDKVLQAEARALAQLSQPLLEIGGKGEMRHCQLRLTEAGRRLRDTRLTD